MWLLALLLACQQVSFSSISQHPDQRCPEHIDGLRCDNSAEAVQTLVRAKEATSRIQAYRLALKYPHLHSPEVTHAAVIDQNSADPRLAREARRLIANPQIQTVLVQ